jgi:hypothetical protein
LASPMSAFFPRQRPAFISRSSRAFGYEKIRTN